MDKPKQISFQDGGHNMCLMVDSLATGWASKLPAQYQVYERGQLRSINPIYAAYLGWFILSSESYQIFINIVM